MVLSILQPSFIPWIGYFDIIKKSDFVIFLDHVQFNKRSWQQRNSIKTPNGNIFLTVPVHTKGKFHQKINEVKIFNLGKKYHFLDKVFLKVLKKYPEKMPKIFLNMFKTSSNTIIKFLSNKSNLIEDIKIINKMPKLIFLKALFN